MSKARIGASIAFKKWQISRYEAKILDIKSNIKFIKKELVLLQQKFDSYDDLIAKKPTYRDEKLIDIRDKTFEQSWIYDIDLWINSRARYAMLARFRLFKVLRNDLNLTLQDIWELTNRHHSSVMYGLTQYETILENDESEQRFFKNIRENILSNYFNKEE